MDGRSSLRLLASLALAGCWGCSLPGMYKPAVNPARGVELTYRTGADRLTGTASAVRQVNFEPASTPVDLPPGCTATLHVQNLLPEKKSGIARTLLVVQHADGKSREVFALDIPVAQLESLAAKLKEQNFFRKTKPEAGEVFLSARVDKVKVGKDFHAIPELDALVLQVRRQGERIVGGLAEANPLKASGKPVSR